MASFLKQKPLQYLKTFSKCEDSNLLTLTVLIFHADKLFTIQHTERDTGNFWLPTKQIVAAKDDAVLEDWIKSLVCQWTGSKPEDLRIDDLPMVEATLTHPLDVVQGQTEVKFTRVQTLAVRVNVFSSETRPHPELETLLKERRYTTAWRGDDCVGSLDPERVPKLRIIVGFAFERQFLSARMEETAVSTDEVTTKQTQKLNAANEHSDTSSASTSSASTSRDTLTDAPDSSRDPDLIALGPRAPQGTGHIKRCYGCGGFGHLRKDCRQENSWIKGRCRNCFQKDHPTEDCPEPAGYGKN